MFQREATHLIPALTPFRHTHSLDSLVSWRDNHYRGTLARASPPVHQKLLLKRWTWRRARQSRELREWVIHSCEVPWGTFWRHVTLSTSVSNQPHDALSCLDSSVLLSFALFSPKLYKYVMIVIRLKTRTKRKIHQRHNLRSNILRNIRAS